jgi:hypothetical protein
VKKGFRLKILDIAAAALGLAAVFFASSLVYAETSGRLMVHITGESGEWLQPLEKAGDIAVEGPLGITYVHIGPEGVHIEDSPCPNKTCVAAGNITLANQWLACMPNSVFITIEGGGAKDDIPDAAVY